MRGVHEVTDPGHGQFSPEGNVIVRNVCVRGRLSMTWLAERKLFDQIGLEPSEDRERLEGMP